MEFPNYRRASTPVNPVHEQWMDLALEQARRALPAGDVPIGAVVVNAAGQVIGAGFNRREADADPTAHAEVLAIRQAAAARGSWRLDDCTLVVTLEPCIMCAGSILLARLPRVIFGAWEEKTGAAGSLYDVLRDRRYPHEAEVITGVRVEESVRLLREFFAARRGE